jgi:hypothetical protein
MGNPGQLQTVGLNPSLDPKKPKSSFLCHLHPATHALRDNNKNKNNNNDVISPSWG